MTMEEATKELPQKEDKKEEADLARNLLETRLWKRKRRALKNHTTIFLAQLGIGRGRTSREATTELPQKEDKKEEADLARNLLKTRLFRHPSRL